MFDRTNDSEQFPAACTVHLLGTIELLAGIGDHTFNFVAVVVNLELGKYRSVRPIRGISVKYEHTFALGVRHDRCCNQSFFDGFESFLVFVRPTKLDTFLGQFMQRVCPTNEISNEPVVIGKIGRASCRERV